MRLEASFRASLEAATASYETSLQEGDDGWTVAGYLKARGITREIAESYRLGVVNDKFPEHAAYKGMLSIPYRTSLGGIVSLKFRRPHNCTADCAHSKYVGPYPTRLFNTVALDAADREGFVCITEGEIDAITIDSAGFPAVGIPGVESWKAHPEWAGVFSGYSRVYMCPDEDEAGSRLAKTIQGDLSGDRLRVIRLGGTDVNDYYVKSGREQFMEEFSERIRRG